MLWYRAWRETQTRFCLSAAVIAALSVCFVVFHAEAAGISDKPLTYVEYIWRITYKGYLRELFVLLALLLGVGGLLRERDHGTSGFTLALPVSRLHLVSTRAAVGIVEIAVLSFLPGLTVCAASRAVGEYYPWSQGLQFGLLWAIGGAFIFMIGFLASSIFAGEYTAPAIAFLALLLYSVMVDVPPIERYVPDVHDMMSGTGMPYFQTHQCLLVGPLPWQMLIVFLITSVGLLVVAGSITQQQDF